MLCGLYALSAVRSGKHAACRYCRFFEEVDIPMESPKSNPKRLFRAVELSTFGARRADSPTALRA
jgi:hypothetical protein